jgi:hypothetical protein
MLKHAGFWGDGDEIDALELIEKRLNVRLRHEDAPNIRTVGDLWVSLLGSNAHLEDSKRNWIRFVVGLTAYTGLNPREICRETLLIEPKKPGALKKLTNWLLRRKEATDA